ncbi:hypothetical protein Bbelb_318850 [Branchiostoma belcheri]|nr:hypothetical protein Bbelb_318850 [Branchiostoma belcheri]
MALPVGRRKDGKRCRAVFCSRRVKWPVAKTVRLLKGYLYTHSLRLQVVVGKLKQEIVDQIYGTALPIAHKGRTAYRSTRALIWEATSCEGMLCAWWGENAGPAQWPDTSRLLVVEAICLQLCADHPSATRTAAGVTVQRWSVIMKEYCHFRQLVLSGDLMMSQTTQLLYNIIARTLTQCQLLGTTHDLAQGLDLNQQIDAIVLDLSKAFDTVPHRRLIEANHGKLKKLLKEKVTMSQLIGNMFIFSDAKAAQTDCEFQRADRPSTRELLQHAVFIVPNIDAQKLINEQLLKWAPYLGCDQEHYVWEQHMKQMVKAGSSTIEMAKYSKVGSSGSILTQHRSHIALSVLGDDVTKIPEILKGHLAISEVAEKAGIKNFDVSLSRHDTWAKANYAVNSQ